MGGGGATRVHNEYSSKFNHNLLERFSGVFEAFRQQREPLVEKLPVEGATCALVLCAVSERLVIYDVNKGTHHRPVVLRDWLCKQPIRTQLDKKQIGVNS